MSRWLLIINLFFLTAETTHGQTFDTLSVNLKDMKLETILDSITYKTGYFFSYNTAAIPEGSLYTIRKKTVEMRELLDDLLVGTGLNYLIIDDQVILKRSLRSGLVSQRESSRRTAVKGWVRIKGTDEVLAGTNVFIDGTTIGTVTGQDGQYALEKLPEGSHQLVFSHIGFTTSSYTIRVQHGSTYAVNAFMVPEATELDSVEIKSLPYVDPRSWLRHYREFEREFIGSSVNALRTSITNREVLNFTYDNEKNHLKAYAEEPLEIVNKALGYQVNCQIEYFEKKEDITSFHVKLRFQHLEHSGRKEKRKWKKNRKLAYNGSSIHFFRSLINGSYEKEGFRFYRRNEDDQIAQLHRPDILKETEDGIYWRLCFEGSILVHYTEELESLEYLRYRRGLEPVEDGSEELSDPSLIPDFQRSELELTESEVILFSNGQLQKPQHVIKKGYWSWERVADLMPNDYDLKN